MSLRKSPVKAAIAMGAGALLALCGVAVAPALSAPPASASAPAAAPPDASPEAAWPQAYIEIFKLAPGQQEAFIRSIALHDEVSAAGGQPPLQVYFHIVGADWDVLFIEPYPKTKPTPAQEAAMAAKRKELNLADGPAYFLEEREMVAAHTDTKTYGPITAGEWLGALDAWRAAHPGADKAKAPQ